MPKSQTTAQQLQYLRRFQTTFIFGTFVLFTSILVAVFAQTSAGHIINFSDPLAIISLSAMSIWTAVGLWIQSAFARQEPSDD